MISGGNIALHRGVHGSNGSWTAVQVIDATGVMVTFVAGGALLGLSLSGALPIASTYAVAPFGLCLLATLDVMAAILAKRNNKSKLTFVVDNETDLKEPFHTVEYPSSFAKIERRNYVVEKVGEGANRQNKWRVGPEDGNEFEFYIKFTRWRGAVHGSLAYEISELFGWNVVPEAKCYSCKEFNGDNNFFDIHDSNGVFEVQRAVKDVHDWDQDKKAKINVVSAQKNLLFTLLFGNSDATLANFVRNRNGDLYSVDNELHEKISVKFFCFLFEYETFKEQPISKQLISSFFAREQDLRNLFDSTTYMPQGVQGGLLYAKNLIPRFRPGKSKKECSNILQEIQVSKKIIEANYMQLQRAFNELDWENRKITPLMLREKLENLKQEES